ncbi:Piso0_000979 [Millerozyma farinosa CBS 7064]|uniref:Piso0_000979 protein n=1 Tax=Pichia sorbitophila (strain ATCC MYA-4447 / BCRC 22081 / CBS 7064 / NBRC 10061 / NRRL Y-12695) TaxID=559304 RepID=G8YQK9_PICSO|nr:Piso0_000979 [Millerozyma farinosa CBS 7064]CCE78944.1 Piso0_000979 [Millerozyma farinosa CBS 7064]
MSSCARAALRGMISRMLFVCLAKHSSVCRPRNALCSGLTDSGRLHMSGRGRLINEIGASAAETHIGSLGRTAGPAYSGKCSVIDRAALGRAGSRNSIRKVKRPAEASVSTCKRDFAPTGSPLQLLNLSSSSQTLANIRRKKDWVLLSRDFIRVSLPNSSCNVERPIERADVEVA